jgi:hypothetical protein
LFEYLPEDAFIFDEDEDDYPKEIATFLFPEWGEIRLKQLRPENEAEHILKKWLDTGWVEEDTI